MKTSYAILTGTRADQALKVEFEAKPPVPAPFPAGICDHECVRLSAV
jgi:hypothetical protein